MSLPSSITASTNYDEASDDPKQARAQLAGLRGDVNTINEHLKLSPWLAPATPLTLGDGLESAGGAGRVKLDGNPGLARDANGLKLDPTALTAETSADDADLIVIHDDSAGARRKMTRANFLSGVGAAAASQAEMEAASSSSVMATPGNAHHAPSAAKAWVNFDGSGTIAVRDSYNVDSLVDNGTGDYDIVFDADFSSDDYCAVGMTSRGSTVGRAGSVCFDSDDDGAMAVGSVNVLTYLGDESGTFAFDSQVVCCAFFGDQ